MDPVYTWFSLFFNLFQLFVMNVQASTDLKGGSYSSWLPCDAMHKQMHSFQEHNMCRMTTSHLNAFGVIAETMGKNIFRNGILGRRAFHSHHQPLKHQKRGHHGQNQQLDGSLQFLARLVEVDLSSCIL